MRKTDTVRSSRDQELRRILEDHRARVSKAVRDTIRSEREEGAMESTEVQDEAEQSEADVQSELDFAVLQMQAETLEQITEALDRLDARRYGFCLDCGAAIPTRRLEALPFATRCVRCEEDREGLSRPATTFRGAGRRFDDRS